MAGFAPFVRRLDRVTATTVWENAMNGLRAGLVLLGIGLASLPGAAPAAESAATPLTCKLSSCVTTTVWRSAGGWQVHFAVQIKHATMDRDVFNLRVLGNNQLELDVPRDQADVSVPAGWDGAFLLQACSVTVISTNCDSWSTFQVELPVADADEQFCNSYADTATSQATEAQQKSCGLDTPAGRWSTDTSAHLNWCLSQFRTAGGVVDKLAAARDLVSAEQAGRTEGLDSCQRDAEAYAAQRADEMEVTGKSAAECAQSNQICEARLLARLGPVNSIGAIATECTPYFVQCRTNAGTFAKQDADQRADEMRVTGKTAEECQQSKMLCETRLLARLGPVNSIGAIATECTPYFAQCMANAAAAAAPDDVAEAPPEDMSEETAEADNGGGMTEEPPAPANTMYVVRSVNVHYGNVKGEVVGSLPAGATIEVFECNKSACRIPFEGDEGFVARSFLALGGGGKSAGGGVHVEIPPPGKKKKVVIAVEPPVEAPAISFAGVWNSRTDKDWSYVLTLKQKGNKVSGGYVAQDGSKGTINGTVVAGVLKYKWTADGGFVGTGSFQMTGEGVMDGNYVTTVYPDPDMDDYYKSGSWHAELQ